MRKSSSTLLLLTKATGRTLVKSWTEAVGSRPAPRLAEARRPRTERSAVWGFLLTSTLLLVGLVASKSAFAESQSISVTGNGSNSVNTTSSSQSQSTFVTQSSNATVTNVVNVNADTGHNQASSNTGGASSVSTGSVSSNVLVNNQVGSNSSSACCTSSADPITTVISGNGSHSQNSLDVSTQNTNVVNQNNSTNLLNKVGGNLNTGGNNVSSNTDGNNNISTGSISSNVTIDNILNKNIATISCCQPTIQAPNPVGNPPVPALPIAAILPSPGQVLAASTKVSALPMTGANDNLWIMSLASVLLVFGFFVRRSASSLLMSRWTV